MQIELIRILLKVFLLSGFVSIALWIGDYTRQAKWWKNQVGLTIVGHAIVVAALLVPTTLSLFFNLRGSLIDAWATTAIIGCITPVMLWRVVVWRKYARDELALRDIERGERSDQREKDSFDAGLKQGEQDTVARDVQDKRNTADRDVQDKRNTAERDVQDRRNRPAD